MTYNVPTNASQFYKLWDFANEATNNFFGIAILIMIFFVSFFSLKGYETPKAFAFASMITTIMAILLSVMGTVNGLAVLVCIVLTAFSVVYLFKQT